MRRSLKKKRNELDFIVMQEYIQLLIPLWMTGKIDLFFFDESSFNLVPNVPYGWQKIGESTELESQRSRNINILGFLSIDNELHSYKSEGSVDSDVVIGCFNDFINERKKDIPLFIIIDNAPTHCSKNFVEMQEKYQNENCYIINLPAYSPELNIIEILWRFIKYKWIEIEAYCSFEALSTNIEEILRKVGDEYFIDFFKDKKCHINYA